MTSLKLSLKGAIDDEDDDLAEAIYEEASRDEPIDLRTIRLVLKHLNAIVDTTPRTGTYNKRNLHSRAPSPIESGSNDLSRAKVARLKKSISPPFTSRQRLPSLTPSDDITKWFKKMRSSLTLDVNELVFDGDGETKPFIQGINSTLFKGTYKGMPCLVKAFNLASSHDISHEFKIEVSAMLLARGCSVNICEIFGARLTPRLEIVMRFYDGGTVTNRLRTGNVSNVQKENWMRELLRALYVIHEADPPLVHGDLKSHNLLLDKDSLILADFGSVMSTKHIYKDFTGTARWAAPERLFGDVIGTFSDMFSVGVICWEFCTDCADIFPYPEFGFDSQVEHALQHNTAHLTFPDKCSKILRRLGAKCLSREIEKRPSAAEALNFMEFF